MPGCKASEEEVKQTLEDGGRCLPAEQSRRACAEIDQTIRDLRIDPFLRRPDGLKALIDG